MLSFCVDPDFGNTLDGLIYVDLTRTDVRVLKRYMGKEGHRRFQEYHRTDRTAQQLVGEV